MTVSTAPNAEKNEEIIIEFPVDDGFIDAAEQEAFSIILQRKTAFEQRWNQRFKLSDNRKKWLRRMELLIAIVGMIIAIGGYFICEDTQFLWFFIIMFLLFLFALFQCQFEDMMRRMSVKRSKKWAKACMGTTRQITPFLASYHINNKNIHYFRSKDGQKQQQWSRVLKGVAIQGEKVTLFFNNKTTLSPPIMVLLHQNPTQIGKILTEVGIETFDMDNTS